MGAILFALGCGREPAPPAPDTTTTTATSAQATALEEAWRAASEGLQVGPTTGDGVALRWRPPTCAKRYAMRWDASVRSLGMDQRGGMFDELELELAPADGGGIWSIATSRHGFSRATGEHLGGHPLPPFADTRVVTDGRTWREADGPTALWNAPGYFFPLQLFSPALPETSAAGAVASWSLPPASPQAINVVESARVGTALDPFVGTAEQPDEEAMEVRLVEWIEIAGRRAAVLEWGGSESSASALGLGAATVGARWVIAEDGTLLHGMIIADTANVGTPTAAITQRAEIRLVRSCDQPVLRPFPTTPAERASIVLGQLRLAVIEYDHDEIASLFESPKDPSMHAARTVALRTTIERWGPFALGDGEVDDVVIHEDGIEIRAGVNLREPGSQRTGTLYARLGAGTPSRIVELRLQNGDDTWLSIDRERVAGSVGSITLRQDASRVVVVTNAVTPLPGRFVLAHDARDACALRFDTDGTTVTSHDVVLDGAEITIGPPRTDRLPADDTHDRIPCGGLTVRWSSPTYLYFERGDGAMFDLMVTDIADADELRLLDRGSPWLSQRWGDLAYDPKAEPIALRRQWQGP
jgi:hypothetical protein